MNDAALKTHGKGYRWTDARPVCAHDYVMPEVEASLRRCVPPGGDVFDLGCGNGAGAARLAALGYKIVGVDPSQEGIEICRRSHPELELHVGSAYDDLPAQYGTFDAVVSLEVVEHVYAPRDYARTVFSLLRPGGAAIVSTPYHGYVKNIALAVSGRFDAHFSPLWDDGHIKFWSVRTLGRLLEEAGFVDVEFFFAGRVRLLAKSMLAVARRPSS